MVDQKIKRQTAYLCTVRQLMDGKYVRRDGWEPSFMATCVGAVSRVRLTGIVVNATSNNVTLDDGSAVISVRSFGNGFPDMRVGSFVLVIGRPRVFEEENYVMVECMHSLSSPAWLLFYKNNLSVFQKCIPVVPEVKDVLVPVVEEKIVSSDDIIVTEPVSSKTPVMIIDIIRELDSGDGAPVDEVLQKAGVGSEDRLQLLIREGEVFELRAGKVKVLE